MLVSPSVIDPPARLAQALHHWRILTTNPSDQRHRRLTALHVMNRIDHVVHAGHARAWEVTNDDRWTDK